MTFSWHRIALLGSSAYLAERRIPNIEVVQSCEPGIQSTPSQLSSARMAKHTGIFSRRYASEDRVTSDLGAQALLPLLSLFNTSLPLKGLIVATTSPDVPSPATANWVHRKCGLNSNIQAFDVASSCSSLLSALKAASGFIASGEACAVVAAELKNKHLNTGDLRTRSLFGDGAAGLALAPSLGNEGFLFAHCELRSEFAERIQIPVGGTREPVNSLNLNRIYLEIQEPKTTYLETVKAFAKAIGVLWAQREKAIIAAGRLSSDVGGVIYLHQANANIILDIKKRLPEEIQRRVPILMSDVGNIVCASLAVTRVRSRFLESVIMNLSLQMPFASITPEFVKNKVFAREGVHAEVWGEKIAIIDGSFGSAGISWIHELQDYEIESVIKACQFGRILPKNPWDNQVFIDLWVAAGGGFQTVGCLHAKNLELK